MFLGVGHNLLKKRDVVRKRLTSTRRQPTSRERTILLVGLCNDHISGLLESSEMSREIAIGHGKSVPQLREGDIRVGG